MSALQAEPTKKAAQQCAVAVEPCRLHADQCCSCGRPTKAVGVSPTVRTVMFLAVLGILTMALFPVVVLRIIALTQILENNNSADGLRSVNSNLTLQAEMSNIANGLNASTDALYNDATSSPRLALQVPAAALEAERAPATKSESLQKETPSARAALPIRAAQPQLPQAAARSHVATSDSSSVQRRVSSTA